MKSLHFLIWMTAVVLTFSLTACISSTSSSKGSTEVVEQNLSSKLNYVAIGASDAVGIGASVNTLGYVFQIRDSLEIIADTVEFTNMGVSGHVIEEMINFQMQSTINANPDIVTIWVGGNDFQDHLTSYFFEKSINTVVDFRSDLKVLLGTLKDSLPDAEIFIADLPDMAKLPSVRTFIGEDPTTASYQAALAIIDSLNTMIREEAFAYQANFIPLSAEGDLTGDSTNISDDGFHPSDQGYGIMTDLYFEAILQYIESSN